MNQQRYIKVLIYLVVSAWAVLLYMQGDSLNSSLLKPLSEVTSIVIWVVAAFDLLLWKLPFLHSWFVKRPVIDGTWTVLLQSSWIDPTTGEQVPAIRGYMVIRQTFSTLSMRLLTAQSSSALVGTEIVCSPDNTYCVSGVYLNEPGFAHRKGSPIHYGALWLTVALNDPAPRLSGHYWTDRNTAGSMELTNRRLRKFQTFDAADHS